MLDSLWLFAYGSLIYKVDFPYLESQPAEVRNWTRRFWHGSHDHRGTPDQPGRVVTLYPLKNARCGGLAYRITAEVLDAIDIREKNGYRRQVLSLALGDGALVEGVAYVADRQHSAFLGPASLDDLAVQIAGCQGESGTNSAYLHGLALSLEQLAIEDHHVQSLTRRLSNIDIS